MAFAAQSAPLSETLSLLYTAGALPLARSTLHTTLSW
jgi:hypothetical protein